MLKDQITQGFARTIDSYSHHATIQKEVSLKLARLISHYTLFQPHSILEIGCGTGFLSQALLEDFAYSAWTVNDINCEVEKVVTDLFDGRTFLKPDFVFGDAEVVDFLSTYNLIASSSCLQWFSNLPLFFAKMAHQLKDNGIFAFSTFGPQNMMEIKAAGGGGLNYFSLEAYHAMLSVNFQVIHCSEDLETLHFSSACDVLHHIKSTGVNGAFRQHWTKGRLSEFSSNYTELCNADGFPLTYHPIYFICKPL